MTSRYVRTWKFVTNEKGEMERTIRLRLVPRGFMDIEAFDVETVTGTARRPSQRLLASTAACKKQELTYQKLAETTGEKERAVRFTLPPGSATVLRTLPGFEHYDGSKHCLQCLKPVTGTNDAPRAFSLKLRRITRGFGLRPTSYDEEFETSDNMLTAKHVDDINMAGTEDTIGKYATCVANIFGKCKLNRHTYTNCAVRYTKDEDGNITLDQDAYIKQLRPIQHPELTSADADAQATKMVADTFLSLRGALACALI
eukprot:9030221-Pyramimonas_sp.AAC.1